jgi:cephalosporin hydroxylase
MDVSEKSSAQEWFENSVVGKYSYNFKWMGIPIIQYPQDIVAMQEIIYDLKPDLIIETGIAHGGSIVFYASLLELNAISGGPKNAKIIGIDIDIRAHNLAKLETHSMFSRMELIEGSSVSDDVVKKVHSISKDFNKVLLILDSNHTEEHVLSELWAYSDLVSIGSYCVVFDTVIEDLPDKLHSDRPWGKGNNPKSAVFKFLAKNSNFVIDSAIDEKIQISVAPSGYLKRVN